MQFRPLAKVALVMYVLITASWTYDQFHHQKTHDSPLHSFEAVQEDHKTFYRIPPSNLTTISETEGENGWRYVRRFTIVANATPSDASLMPIFVDGLTGEVNGFVYSAFAETRTGHPTVIVMSYIHNRGDQFYCLFHWTSIVDWAQLVDTDPNTLMRAATSPFDGAEYPFAAFILCPLPNDTAQPRVRATRLSVGG